MVFLSETLGSVAPSSCCPPQISLKIRRKTSLPSPPPAQHLQGRAQGEKGAPKSIASRGRALGNHFWRPSSSLGLFKKFSGAAGRAGRLCRGVGGRKRFSGEGCPWEDLHPHPDCLPPWCSLEHCHRGNKPIIHMSVHMDKPPAAGPNRTFKQTRFSRFTRKTIHTHM